jgi:hypothetical protein
MRHSTENVVRTSTLDDACRSILLSSNTILTAISLLPYRCFVFLLDLEGCVEMHSGRCCQRKIELKCFHPEKFSALLLAEIFDGSKTANSTENTT